ncbi:Replication-relaxation [Nonomuraea jiangxiensis]|uniref:Replication-relaxation n=2 Tax=Nonomuraea jiangxiensis TaxID=633440 RepID=A0A1G9UND0_9ACTN|nr:Replication-relaxation [Nonomuraea jiangxiensis]
MGSMPRPDAYARWTEGSHSIEFFLEYDTRTEPLDRVAHKLDGYAKLTESSRTVTPVLFWVQGETPRGQPRKKLRHHPGNMFVPTATGHAAAIDGTVEDGPVGARRLPTDLDTPWCRLAELALTERLHATFLPPRRKRSHRHRPFSWACAAV